MINNREIKLLNSLKRKKIRNEEGLFVVEGEKNVAELLNSKYTIRSIYATKLWNNDTPHTIISEKDLQRVSSLSSSNKVLALVEIPKQNKFDTTSTSLVIDGVNDPGNLGTIIRTADWFGINQIVCSENSVDRFNAKTIMASMGSVFRVNVIYTELKDFLSKSELTVFGALLEGDSLFNTQFKDPCHILLGSESHGISKELIPFIDYKTTIPGAGNAESLNLGVSTSIFCSEYFRQISVLP